MSEFDGMIEYKVAITLEWDAENQREFIREDWRHGNLRDRHHGPAHIKRDPKTGEVFEAEYWRNGQRMFTDPEFPITPNIPEP